MIRRAQWAFVTLTAVIGPLATAASCTDLFHSTDDFKNMCESDVTACAHDATVGDTGAEVDGAKDSGIGRLDFCKWDGATARSNAERACAWLSACELPIGNNQFGSCMFHAILAYDCTANPNQPVIDEAKNFWQCLAQATTCDVVHQCVFPVGLQCDAASPEFTRCSQTDGGPDGAPLEKNENVHVTCRKGDPNAYGENCAAWGQTCAERPQDSVGGCYATKDAAVPCDASVACQGDRLRFCTPFGDKGLDCTQYGAGACRNGGCVPSGDQATQCTPSRSIRCSGSTGSIASWCRSGFNERVDCTSLTGEGSCESSDGAVPLLNLASACVGSDSNDSDHCLGDAIFSSYQGTKFTTSCKAQGLSTCELIQLPGEDRKRARCRPL